MYFGKINFYKAITRSFGDFNLKNKVIFKLYKGVSVDPFVKKIELRLINKYLIIASDGVWDVI